MSDICLKEVLSSYSSKSYERYTADINFLERVLKTWANTCFKDLKISGSVAKGTSVDLSSDLDLFLSLKNNCVKTTQELFEELFAYLSKNYSNKYHPKKQNVSIIILIAFVEISVLS